MVTRRPHTATIAYRGTGTKNPTTGVFTEGAETSVSISCLGQPNNSGRFIVGTNGDQLSYSWTLISDPFGEADNIPDKATVTFKGKEYKLLRITVYQKHLEIKI